MPDGATLHGDEAFETIAPIGRRGQPKEVATGSPCSTPMGSSRSTTSARRVP